MLSHIKMDAEKYLTLLSVGIPYIIYKKMKIMEGLSSSFLIHKSML